jgi:hypothetical protein
MGRAVFARSCAAPVETLCLLRIEGHRGDEKQHSDGAEKLRAQCFHGPSVSTILRVRQPTCANARGAKSGVAGHPGPIAIPAHNPLTPGYRLTPSFPARIWPEGY